MTRVPSRVILHVVPLIVATKSTLISCASAPGSKKCLPGVLFYTVCFYHCHLSFVLLELAKNIIENNRLLDFLRCHIGLLVLRNTGFGHAGFQPGDFYRALLLNTANKCLPALPNVANDCICFIMNIGGEGDTFSVTAFDIHNRRLSLIGFKTSKDNRALAWYGNRTGALHFDVVFQVFSVQSNFVFLVW